jgi:2-methylisocitrate lyase-like PEP mutase family enzyme
MSTQPSAAVRLRERLRSPEPLVAPGAINALFARLIEASGFEAVYVTGAGVANATLGVPDLGLTTLTEMAQAATHICDAVRVPVIADADTGYGGTLNVGRTVREYERAGVAAIQIEDQESPKRCGHLDGKRLVGVDQARVRVRAAIEARSDPDTVIIARTDACGVTGVEDAIERCRAYRAEGADVLFCDGPRDQRELARLGGELGGLAPVMVNLVEGGRTPLLPVAALGEMGFRLVIFPGLLMRVAVRAAREALDVLRREGSSESLLDRLTDLAGVNDILDLRDYERRVAQLEDGLVP